jgi:uncharacterized RDD family membrane protein YckC
MSDAPAPTAPRGFLNMPRLPVAGFFSRVFAFMLDFALLIGAIHLLSNALPDLFWALGRASGYVTGLFFFLYFVLFDGPFGKGRTIGKTVLGIAVTDYDGQSPTYRQAAIRAAVLMPAFVLIPVAETIFGHGGSEMERYLKTALGSFPMIAMLLATGLVIPFNPFKQGMHDYVAGTLVQPNKGEARPQPLVELAALVGGQWRVFHRQPQISGLVTFMLFFAVLLIMSWPGRHDDLQRAYLESRWALNKIPGFARADIEGPFPKPIYDMQQGAWAAPKADQGEEAGQGNPIGPTTNMVARLLDEYTTKPMHLIVEASIAGNWPFDPAREEAISSSFLDTYYATTFRALLPVLESGVAASRDEEKQPMAELAKRWRENGVTLSLAYVKKVYLSPHGRVLRRDVAMYTKSFPPIGGPGE